MIRLEDMLRKPGSNCADQRGKVTRMLEEDDETRTSILCRPQYLYLGRFLCTGKAASRTLLPMGLATVSRVYFGGRLLACSRARGGIAAELQWSDMKRKDGRREKDIMMINPTVRVLGISRAMAFPIAVLAHHGKI
jgi:hypothetical protein